MEILILPLVMIIVVAIALIVIKLVTTDTKQEDLLPYRKKKYFFSRSEQQFFEILIKLLDKEKYIVFPKVRLGDFIETTAKEKEYWKWWNKIKSKHIDFLIWNSIENKIVLAIELDGKSHQSEKMKTRDEFINKLYETAGIRLERVVVGTNFLEEIEKLVKSLRE